MRPLLLLVVVVVLCAVADVGAGSARLPRGLGDLLTGGEPPAAPLNATAACLCVPFYNCEDGQLITDGAGLLNPRFGPRKGCQDFNVCCNDDEKIKKIEAKPGVDKSVMTSIKDGISDLFTGDSATNLPGAGSCVCVAFYMCDGNVLAPNVASQVDLRQVSSTGRCSHDNELCCTIPKATTTGGTAAPTSPACTCSGRQHCSQQDIQPLQLGQTACRPEEVCCSKSQTSSGGSGSHSSAGVVPDTQKPDYDVWKFCKSYPFSVACVRTRQMNGRPTLLPDPYFDPNVDAAKLQAAIGWLDATDDVLINILTRRTFEERYLISQKYDPKQGSLRKDIKRTTRGHFDDLMVALVQSASYYEYLAQELYDSMHGVGTDEDTVLETLISSTNDEIEILKRHYYDIEGHPNLIDDIKGDFSGDLEDILVALVNGSRDNSFRVSQERAREQAAALYQAGKGQLGTEEATFKYYLTHENYAQLALIFSEYEQLAGEPFTEALKDEFTRHVEDATLAIVEVTRNLPRFFALRLHDALWGRGPISKDDSSLIRIIVSRAEIDLGNINNEYEQIYGRKLVDDVKLKSTGDYDTALTILLGGA